MGELYKFKGTAFIYSSRDDKDGCDLVVFQFDPNQKVEVAKLRLTGRDLINHLPVLLDVEVSIAENQGKKTADKADTIRAPKQRHNISRRSAGT